jgi:hypothetical protein
MQENSQVAGILHKKTGEMWYNWEFGWGQKYLYLL